MTDRRGRLNLRILVAPHVKALILGARHSHGRRNRRPLMSAALLFLTRLLLKPSSFVPGGNIQARWRKIGERLE